MKNPTFNVPMLVLFLCFFTCSNEPLTDSTDSEENDFNSNILDRIASFDEDEHCVYTNLIAGQHHNTGSVTIDVDGDKLIVIYSTNDDWTLGTTHLSIGICDDDWVPTNGSGSPKIGHFEYTEPYSIEPHQVIYIIPITEIGDNYCFAAHAEVQGPTGGETAWGEGTSFSGNSWAMFEEFNLSDCKTDIEHIPT